MPIDIIHMYNNYEYTLCEINTLAIHTKHARQTNKHSIVKL